tara:strand:+ start:48 stop:314 length:267 start_codon:yes stop_codon:yes gene_type:complete
LTSVPTPGKNNATSKIKDNTNNNQSNFLKKSDGMRRKKQKIIKPIEIKIACLEAKKKGLSYIDSASTILEERTIISPKISKRTKVKRI